MNVWDVASSRPGWTRLAHSALGVAEAARAANGQYWREHVQAVQIGHDTAAFNTPYGVCILRDEGDELCVISFNGHSYAKAFEELRALCRETGWQTFRAHTDKESILRYWRKMGITPSEYIYREAV